MGQLRKRSNVWWWIVGIVLVASVGAAPGEARPSRKHTTSSRAAHAKTPRHREAAQAFRKQTGYPHGRRGYVVDHVVPLACGGADTPSNMQWQTIEAAKAKDKVERTGPGCK